jgi:hypothetical protein
MNVELVYNRISALSLFANLGKIEPDISSMSQIESWDDWTGPEDPLVQEIHNRQQEIYNSIIAPEEDEIWKKSIETAADFLSKSVPYDPDEDSWYGPNMAVWHAAWTFALEVAHANKGLPCPPEIEAQVHWFAMGHWPCALKSPGKLENINDYVVY